MSLGSRRWKVKARGYVPWLGDSKFRYRRNAGTAFATSKPLAITHRSHAASTDKAKRVECPIDRYTFFY
jgi:myo-inositol-1-phosphate synthase|tara:strand:+ start:376 stop:582 length:207 start_codon:yes stop_codon:yes gene_type:complete